MHFKNLSKYDCWIVPYFSFLLLFFLSFFVSNDCRAQNCTHPIVYVNHTKSSIVLVKNISKCALAFGVPGEVTDLQFVCESLYPTTWYYKGMPNSNSFKNVEIHKWRFSANSTHLKNKVRNVTNYLHLISLTASSIIPSPTPFIFISTIDITFKTTGSMHLGDKWFNLTCAKLTEKNQIDPNCFTQVVEKGFGSKVGNSTGEENAEKLYIEKNRRSSVLANCTDDWRANISWTWNRHNGVFRCQASFEKTSFSLFTSKSEGKKCEYLDSCVAAQLESCGAKNTEVEVDSKYNCTSANCGFVNLTDDYKTQPGLLTCSIRNESLDEVLFTYHQPYFGVRNLSYPLYSRFPSDIPPEAVITVSSDTSKFYDNSSVVFKCEASAHYFSHGFEWRLLDSGNHTIIGPVEPTNCTMDKQLYSLTLNLTINWNNHKNVTEVVCWAPVWNSVEWMKVSMPVEILEIKAQHNNYEHGKDDDDSSPSSLSGSLLYGLIAGGVLFLLLIVALCVALYFMWKRIKSTRNDQVGYHLTEEEIQEFLAGVNNAASDALLLPYNVDLEIPRDQVIIEETVLGSGHYGIVKKGRVGQDTVAVKTIKASADKLNFKALLSELKIMSYVGHHSNIVNLIGACTSNIRKREVLLILDYCPNDNLMTYLRNSRAIFLDYTTLAAKQNRNSPLALYQNSPQPIDATDLLRFAHEIACGMEFLSSKNVIHGDLAARNVLVTELMHAKVCDFGLAKQLFDYSIYIQKVDCPLPLRWMAVESLQDMEFSLESDVWSYGVTLWEIFSLAEVPYPGVQWSFDSWRTLKGGYRMEKPQFASDAVYKAMLACWDARPEVRPTFNALKTFFANQTNTALKLSGKNILYT